MAHHKQTSAEKYPDAAVRLGIRLHRRKLEYREIVDRFLERGLPFPEQRALFFWANGETKQSRRIIDENPSLWP